MRGELGGVFVTRSSSFGDGGAVHGGLDAGVERVRQQVGEGSGLEHVCAAAVDEDDRLMNR